MINLSPRDHGRRSWAAVPRLRRAGGMHARTGARSAALLHYALVAVLLGVVARAMPQQLVDLGDPVYDLLSRAEERGLLAPLPLLRPYPRQLVLTALEDIRARGNRSERELAAGYLAALRDTGREILGQPLVAPIHVAVGHDSRWLDDHAGSTGFDLQSTGALGGLVSYSGVFAVDLVEHPSEPTEPRLTLSGIDGASGGARMEIGDQPFSVDLVWKGTLGVGTDSLYFQCGLTRSVLGPFYDSSVVLGAQAPAAGHFSLTYRRGWLTASSVLLELQARYAEDAATGEVYSLRSRLGVEDAFPAKYLALHTVMVSPARWLDLTLIQSVLFGGRFSPLYLVPFQMLQYTQVFVRNYDNALAGLAARVRLPGGLGVSAVMYVDDWNFNEAVQGNLDSGQNKFALQAGLSWSPWFGVLENVRAQYAMVTPYMYTHTARQPINYLTYEHAGEQLGSILPPNSDELSLKASLRPASWLTIDLGARRVRHANGSDFGDVVYGDGSIYDDGFTPSGTAVFVDHPSTFMTQAVIEKMAQLAVDLRARIPLWRFRLDLGAGYTFQYVVNPDLVATPAPEIGHAFRLGVGVRY